MSLLNEILTDVDFKCIRQECAGDCCSLDLQDLDPNGYILICMDGEGAPISQTSTRCDFLFFGHVPNVAGFWAIPVELTRGASKTLSTIVNQLRSGAQVTESLIPESQAVQFTPVAAGPFGKHKRTEMRKTANHVMFRKDTYPIELATCGDKLTHTLTPQPSF